VINDGLRRKLLTMRAEDMRVRQELLGSGELVGSYVPRMEAVHVRNAARLGQLIAVHGWPDETLAGKDGAEAAWLIVQHAIGEPAFQREMLGVLHACGDAKHIRFGKRRIWKIGLRWMRADRRFTVRSGSMIRVMAEFGRGASRSRIE